MKTPKLLNKIDSNTINYMESAINYTIIYLNTGKTVVSAYNIKIFEALFQDHRFIKINRSKLINKTFITKTSVFNNVYSVELANGKEIPIARRRLNRIMEEYPMMF